MSEYALTVGIDRDEVDGLSYDDREELFDEISEHIDGDFETEHPPKLLSEPTYEALLTVGTILLSNPDQLALLYQTLKEMPQFDVEGVGIRMDNKFVFEMPDEANIDVDVNVLCNVGNKTLYEAEEKPEAVKERERERFIEEINKGQPEGEEFNSYEEFKEEYGSEED